MLPIDVAHSTKKYGARAYRLGARHDGGKPPGRPRSLSRAAANGFPRRINPLPFFNFTRSDYIRALFLFDRDEPIGEEGLRYLKSHVAGCADGNKWSTVERPGNLDFAGRIAWTDDNLPQLREIGNAVLHGEDPGQWACVLQPDMADTLVTFAKPGGDIVEISCGDPYSFIAARADCRRAERARTVTQGCA